MEGYTPFKMKAKDYGNSPMLMNFPDSFPGGVGSSPAKGFFSRIAKKVKNLSKKVLGKTAIGKVLGIGKDKKDPSMVTEDATTATTQPHTHDETGAIVPEAEGPQTAVAETVDGPKSAKEMQKQKMLERIKSGKGMFGGGANKIPFFGGGGGGMWLG
jgi:hypothetical protein|tara:strand:+ start:39 stop:509 length:471 start_codon:yes stop_codon:yes gene_type:complete